MKVKISTKAFTVETGSDFKLSSCPNALQERLYKDKKGYKKRLLEFQEEIDELQTMMYAQDRFGVLIIFQAMDAAGKDGTIKHVMSGVNPHGVKVYAFKRPSDNELDHDFMWRTTVNFPQRGTIGIFNRSYYEEVLVCKVHPEIVQQYQRLPEDRTKDMATLWKRRYSAIRDLERYAHDNGIVVLKFFLNVSKEEQKRRFLERMDVPEKNWKFEEGDVKERGFWKAYMAAYEECIRETATVENPWYVVPADDKQNMRLIVSKIILERLEALDLHYPEVSKERLDAFTHYREMLESEANE